MTKEDLAFLRGLYLLGDRETLAEEWVRMYEAAESANEQGDLIGFASTSLKEVWGPAWDLFVQSQRLAK